MNNFKNIVLYSSIGLLSLSVYVLILKCQYGTAVAMAGILLTIFIPFFTKDLELEKHRTQLLFEKKYNAYSKYFNIFDDFYHSSMDIVVKIEVFNKKKHKNEKEFEKHKQELIEALKQFFDIQKYLSMPSLEFLMYANKEIEGKIEEIVDIEGNIDSEASLTENAEKIKVYIKILSELAVLLQSDLKIKIND